MPVPVIAGPQEATAVGNIAVQAMGTGFFADLRSALLVMLAAFDISRYEPKNPEIWTEQYIRFKKYL